MSTSTDSTTSSAPESHASWFPLVIILLAQIQMAFNVNALPVLIGPISEDLNTPATTISTALVVYSLFVAAFVMVGAKLGRKFGSRLVFQIGVAAHGAAMGLMALSPSAQTMVNAQALAGIAAAGLVPTLVVLTAATYHGRQQSQALGLIAGAPAASGVMAFLIAGFLGTVLNWRYSFALLVVVAIVGLILSFRLKPVERDADVQIDTIGAILAAVGVILISFGFNNLNSWGLLWAKPEAPFDLLGISPALLMIVFGVLLGQAFFAWSHQIEKTGKSPLLSLAVLDSRQERSAIFAMLIIGAVAPAVNFLIPLYIQIVQGQTSLQTSIAVVPYTVAIFTSAVLIVRLYDRFTPRQIGVVAFIIVAVALTLLAFTIGNGWGTPVVIIGLVTVGIGEGALLTLLFNVLVTASPKELAGDVGALRGTANNLSTALGTATAAAMAVGFLGLAINSGLVNNPAIPPSLKVQVNLDNINFISNDQLDDVLAQTDASDEQIAEAVRINSEARLAALQASFLVLAAVALLAIFPALGLPAYRPGEVPAEELYGDSLATAES